MKKVLFVGNPDSGHTVRFLKNLHAVSPDIEIDLFCENHISDTSEISKYCSRIYNSSYRFPSFLYRIPKICSFLLKKDSQLVLSQIPSSTYDIVNVHFVGTYAVFQNSDYHRIGRKVLLSPYGSDVLRASKDSLQQLNLVYSMADGVTLSPMYAHEFYSKVKNQFQLPDNKIYEAGFGSDAIDELLIDDWTKEQAKSFFNLSGRFVITVGYNGSIGQQHISVINAIERIKVDLPSSLTVIIPASYPANNKNYLSSLEKILQNNKIDYRVIKNYLSLKDLVRLRKCSDIFIHAQKTDAGCASVMEYMLTDTVIINGDWLPYPELEKYGKPYLSFGNFEQLGTQILEGLRVSSLVNKDHIDYISKRGWKEEIKYWGQCYNILLNEC